MTPTQLEQLKRLIAVAAASEAVSPGFFSATLYAVHPELFPWEGAFGQLGFNTTVNATVGDTVGLLDDHLAVAGMFTISENLLALQTFHPDLRFAVAWRRLTAMAHTEALVVGILASVSPAVDRPDPSTFSTLWE